MGLFSKFSSLATVLGFIFTTQAQNLGQWGPTIDFPLVPVAGAMLPSGKLLVWSSYAETKFAIDKLGQTTTAVYDPVTRSISEFTVTETKHDMFCPGISMDKWGSVVVTGGDHSLKTSIHTGDNKWIEAAPMNLGRGYQSSTTCSDGRVFTIGGSYSGDKGGKDGEIFDSKLNTWKLLPGAAVAPMLTADVQGPYRSDNHAWLFAWRNGAVFQAGPSMAMNWYSTRGNGAQLAAGTRDQDGDSMNGNSVMYDAEAGKILTIGGAPNYGDVGKPTVAHNRAHIVTIGAPGYSAEVEVVEGMAFARGFANSVVLPDGKVLVIGGQSKPLVFEDSDSILTPELWDPATKKFTQLAPMAIPRNYHSISLLMPDGTVFSGGGGLCGGWGCKTNHQDGSFFSPPYLFLDDGVTAATRPVISSVSSSIFNLHTTRTRTITVAMDSAVTAFSLVRMGSATHSINTDQRRIALTPTLLETNTYTVTIPSDSGVALPGYWMLFAINAEGVPSLALTVRVKLS